MHLVAKIVNDANGKIDEFAKIFDLYILEECICVDTFESFNVICTLFSSVLYVKYIPLYTIKPS